MGQAVPSLVVLVLVLLNGAAVAQQPAQPVLPSATQATSPVSEMAPCLPELDPDLGLHFQSCKQFHGDAPPPDWIDRMVVSVTAPAAALAWSDLDALEQAEVRRHAPANPVRLQTVTPAELSAAMEAFKAWATLLSVPPPAGRPGPNPPPQGLAQPSSAAPPHGPGNEKQATGGISKPPDKRDLLPLLEARPVDLLGGPEVPPLTPPLVVSLSVQSGDVVTVTVPQVKPAPGWLWPDPVLWLLRTDRPGDPESGTVVAAADDGPGGLPSLTWTADQECRLRLLVAPWTPRAAGTVALNVKVGDETVYETDGVFFGGRSALATQLASGDRIFAGAVVTGIPAPEPGTAPALPPSATPSLDHDATLWLLPPPWATLPAPYQATNNAAGTLPGLTVGHEMPEAFLIAGAFLPDSSPEVRLFVSRGSSRGDQDRDGLSADIEVELGTCDSKEQASASACGAPVPLPPGWNARDTDNDGLSDFEEVFGVRRCYAESSKAPYHEAPDCMRGPSGTCLDECPADARMIAVLPLSALGAVPTVYDFFLEYDYWQPANAPPAQHSIPPAELEATRRAFEEAYTHEPADGSRVVPRFVAPPYPFKLHIFQDDPIAIPDATRMAHIPALGHRSLAFDLFFSPDRKYTNTFHYMVGIHKGGGQTDVSGRASVIGATGKGGLSVKLIHEAGHLLGLLHNFRSPSPDNSALYLSEMSYGYSHTMPPPIDWDGVFDPCGASRPCRPGFRCATFSGHGKLCAPDCGLQDEGAEQGRHFVRFSSGELPLTGAETGTLPETGYPRWFLPYLYCYSEAGKGTSLEDRLARFWSPACDSSRCIRCSGDLCDVDWDRDGRFLGAVNLDVDKDGKLNPAPVTDGSDWLRMIETGRRGLGVTGKKTLPAYYSGFTARSGANLMPYPSVVHEHNGGYVTDVTNVCDEVDKWPHCRDQHRGEAALFRGPASGDSAIEVRLPSEWCTDLQHGLSVSLRVKPFVLPPDGEPVVLFDSVALQLLLVGDGDSARWVARITAADGETNELEVDDRLALGRWTRLTVMVYNSSGKAVLHARRGITDLFDEEGGIRVGGKLCVLSVGAPAGQPSTFTGLLDDPMVLSGPAREL